MKKVVGFVICLCLVFVITGCATDEKLANSVLEENISENLEESVGENEDKKISGKLVISLPYYFGSIVDQVEAFRAAYPEVELEVRSATEPGEPLSDMVQFDEYIQQMAVDIMSGSDVDIYETSWLSYYKYAKSGVLEDLYPFMEIDSDFHEEDYYMNILRALEYNGQLCLMPSHVTYDLLRMNTCVAGEVGESDSINYREIQDIYERSVADGKFRENAVFSLNDSAMEAVFARNEYTSYIDIANGKAGFDAPEFQNYLAFAREHLNWGSAEGKIFMDLPVGQNDWLVNCFRMDLFTIQEESKEVSKPMLLASSSGNHAFATIGEILSISSFSENKELAWEFIKFIIKEKEYPFEEYELEKYREMDYYISSIPVNRRNFEKTASAILEKRFGKDMSEQVAHWDEINQKLDTVTFVDIQINETMEELREEFCQGRLNEEEYAALLQERVQMYFME